MWKGQNLYFMLLCFIINVNAPPVFFKSPLNFSVHSHGRRAGWIYIQFQFLCIYYFLLNRGLYIYLCVWFKLTWTLNIKVITVKIVTCKNPQLPQNSRCPSLSLTTNRYCFDCIISHLWCLFLFLSLFFRLNCQNRWEATACLFSGNQEGGRSLNKGPLHIKKWRLVQRSHGVLLLSVYMLPILLLKPSNDTSTDRFYTWKL